MTDLIIKVHNYQLMLIEMWLAAIDSGDCFSLVLVIMETLNFLLLTTDKLTDNMEIIKSNNRYLLAIIKPSWSKSPVGIRGSLMFMCSSKFTIKIANSAVSSTFICSPHSSRRANKATLQYSGGILSTIFLLTIFSAVFVSNGDLWNCRTGEWNIIILFWQQVQFVWRPFCVRRRESS